MILNFAEHRTIDFILDFREGWISQTGNEPIVDIINLLRN